MREHLTTEADHIKQCGLDCDHVEGNNRGHVVRDVVESTPVISLGLSSLGNFCSRYHP